MNIFPRRDDFLKLATQGNVIPVYADLMADFETPVSAYAKLKAAGPSYLLESVEGGEQLSRYSFIGCRPHKQAGRRAPRPFPRLPIRSR
jgi:anthranilate synthase component I